MKIVKTYKNVTCFDQFCEDNDLEVVVTKSPAQWGNADNPGYYATITNLITTETGMRVGGIGKTPLDAVRNLANRLSGYSLVKDVDKRLRFDYEPGTYEFTDTHNQFDESGF